MIKNSNNAMLYRGRYIRRIVNNGWAAESYAVSWSAGGSERTVWYGSLKKLLEHLDDTVRFFGRWDRLL